MARSAIVDGMVPPQVHHDGPPLDGTPEPCSEVEFYLDGEMVHINAQKPERAHSEVFLEQPQTAHCKEYSMSSSPEYFSNRAGVH
eukprot:6336849-Amphidinium_carterae.1